MTGCNFTPSTAGNQLELWQADTFDPDTIDRELGWAADLGFNSMRVFLHDLCWSTDGEAFLDRVDRVLDIAAGRGIRLMPVLFDGVWHPDPRPGRQPDPRPGVHNSIWIQGPGREILGDPHRWPDLRDYVEAVDRPLRPRRAGRGVGPVQRAGPAQSRVGQARDAGQAGPPSPASWTGVFDWAQAVDPDQPLTAGLFYGLRRGVEAVSGMNRLMLSRSDVISFHAYVKDDRLTEIIELLERYDRPLLCTEWLARTAGSGVRQLEVFAEHGVGRVHLGPRRRSHPDEVPVDLLGPAGHRPRCAVVPRVAPPRRYALRRGRGRAHPPGDGNDRPSGALTRGTPQLTRSNPPQEQP